MAVTLNRREVKKRKESVNRNRNGLLGRPCDKVACDGG